MEYPIFYIHMEPYIVGKLGYISQLLTRYYCNLSCTEGVIFFWFILPFIYCTFDLNSLSGLWKSKFLFHSHWDYWRAGQKNRSPTCGMVWWSVLAEIYLVVDYLGLIHVYSNLDLKLLMVSRARWSGVSAHKGMNLKHKSLWSKHFKIYFSNFSC